MLGKYKVPKPIRDEDKWFKYFTKVQLLSILGAVVVGLAIIRFTYRIHMVFLGIIVALLIVIATALATMGTIPEEKYLFGGGCPVWQIGFRILNRKFIPSNKVIYTFAQEDESENPFE